MQRTSTFHAAAFHATAVERAFLWVGGLVSATLRDIASMWRARQRRRLDRVPAAFAHMDARMLRDIGAPDWMLDRAAAERQQWTTIASSINWPPTF